MCLGRVKLMNSRSGTAACERLRWSVAGGARDAVEARANPPVATSLASERDEGGPKHKS